MAEKKDNEVKVETTETKKVEKKKGGGGKIVMIVLAVVLVILLLCGGVAFFAYRSATDRVEEVTDVWEQIGQEVEKEMEEIEQFEEETWEDEAEESEYPKVDGELLEQNLLSDRFPEDIPLSGGTIRDSSFDNWFVSVNIMTSSSVEEAFLWYEETMEETDWVITSKSRQDDSASINFENELEDDDFRRGEISITESWRGYTNVMVRERY